MYYFLFTDVVENIVNRISTDRSKRNITQKLLALSLINDTKELKKKTKKRNGKSIYTLTKLITETLKSVFFFFSKSLIFMNDN